MLDTTVAAVDSALRRARRGWPRPDRSRTTHGRRRVPGQLAAVAYGHVGDGRYEAHGVQALTLIGNRIARITAFNDPSLVPTFGLPLHYLGGKPRIWKDR